MKNLQERAIEATVRYLTMKGYDIVDRGWAAPEGIGSIDLVAVDEGTIVFVDVRAKEVCDGFPTSPVSREIREILAARWLAAQENTPTDVAVRFDDVSIMVTGTDKALLKHHISSLRFDQVEAEA